MPFKQTNKQSKSTKRNPTNVENLAEEAGLYTLVIMYSYFGPDSDPPSHSYHWKVEPFKDYEDACEEAKKKAFENVSPGCTLRAYREGEERTGLRGEFEVQYRIDHEETSMQICISDKYSDADFREQEA